MSPTLTLAPWELPPLLDAPLSAPADFVFPGMWSKGGPLRETEIWARAIPSSEDTLLFYFCDGKHPEAGNWLLMLRREEYEHLDTDNVKDFYSNYEGFGPTSTLRLVYFEGTPYSFPGWHNFQVSLSGTCFLDIDPAWQSDDLDSATLHSLSAANLQLGSALYIKEQLFAALDDATSEARIALEWLHLSSNERQHRLLQFERGNLDEMQSLMRAVLHSQSDLWQSNQEWPLRWETRDWYDNEYFSNIQFSRLFLDEAPNKLHVPRYQRAPFEFDNSDTLTALYRWKNLLWDYFGPSFNEPLFDSAQCVRDSCDDLATITATAESPTAHHRLEARMLLRDWWQQKYAPLLFGN